MVIHQMEHPQLLWILHRQRAPHHRIHQAENCRVRSNSERKREDDYHREHRTSAKRANRVTKVLPQFLKPYRTPHLPAAFQIESRVAEIAPGLLAGFGYAHAGLDEVIDPFRNVRFNFFGEFAMDATLAQARQNPLHDSITFITLAMPSSMRSKLET